MFNPITLKTGKQITSVLEGLDFVDRQIGTRSRSELHWVNAIAELNGARWEPTRAADARAALYKALVADNLV
jgi:hypothetical protein